MTTATAEATLGELYARYKGLALSTGAALVLGADTDELAEEAAVLLSDCRSAAAASPEPQLAACIEAADELCALLAGHGDVESVRASHRRLRRHVWNILPCEYVPCCASEHRER
jgi:hypothetical protein